jgi:predicted ATPase/class 3 adenylate cyclase
MEPDDGDLGSDVLPAGTVTFVLSDVESSTRLWEADPDAMGRALARHDAILAQTVREHGGTLLKHKGEGDSAFAVFSRASDAVAAAIAAQRALGVEPWPDGCVIRVRMAVHTGEAELRDGDYYGPAVNRTARLRGIAHGGQTVISQATADLIRDRVPTGARLVDLGVHRLPDLGGAEVVFGLAHADIMSQFPPLRSLDSLPNNLPLQLTSFIGRSEEMAELRDLLGAHRLVTLTGAAGCGKTRLALQVAAEALPTYRAGVWVIDLAPLSDPDLVTQVVARTLGIGEPDVSTLVDARDAGALNARPLIDLVIEHLRSRELLLVFDNCEHLLNATSSLVGTLLLACADLRVLATSRESLGVAGEVTWRVRSLSTPDPKTVSSAATLLDYEAIRLFVDRARAHVPSFTLTAEDGPAVSQVCRRLDGIPLAIELAAARVETLSAPQLAARLEDRFRLLTGGSRTGLERHQTLRAAVDWSYDTLSESERVLLDRLSVFAGGCTLEAAEEVCVGADVDGDTVLDLLARLVAKSLVVTDRDLRGARYRLLEMIRQYCREMLVASGDQERLRVRHRDWCAALAGRAQREVFGPGQASWLDILEAENDNLRQALDYTIASGDTEVALRLVGALGRFWMVRGGWEEGRRFLRDALALPGVAAYPFLRAQALNTSALIELGPGGNPATARAMAKDALAIYRDLGTRRGIFWALQSLAHAAIRLNDLDAAESLADEAVTIARSAGHDPTIAYALHQRAVVATHRGDYATAEGLLSEALPIMRHAGDTNGVAQTLAMRGVAITSEGDFRAAAPLFLEALDLYRQLGNHGAVRMMRIAVGSIALVTDEPLTARDNFNKAYAGARDAGDRYIEALASCGLGEGASSEGDFARAFEWYADAAKRFAAAETFPVELPAGGLAPVFAGLAKIAAADGSCERAAVIFGAAQGARDEDPVRHISLRWLLYEHDFDHYLDMVRSSLGEDAFARAFAEGRSLSPEAAIARALERERPDEG